MRALLLLLLLAACAPPAKTNTPDPPPLAGTRWVMEMDGAIHATPTLEFREANRASGFTGCNQWFAQIDRAGGGLQFSAIGVTRRACEPPAMEIELDFTERLARTNAVQVEENALTLIDANGEIIARFTRVR
jgi:heat shock protein HslJ